jgi:hypothetical protein
MISEVVRKKTVGLIPKLDFFSSSINKMNKFNQILHNTQNRISKQICPPFFPFTINRPHNLTLKKINVSKIIVILNFHKYT